MSKRERTLKAHTQFTWKFLVSYFVGKEAITGAEYKYSAPESLAEATILQVLLVFFGAPVIGPQWLVW